MMDYRYIEQLLQRYFDCETNLQEEAILRVFFRQNDIPVGLEKYRELFAAGADFAAESLSDGFEARIMEKVENTTVIAQRITLGRRLMPLYKAVAGVAIVITLGFAAQRGIAPQGNATVTPHQAQPAGEQISVLQSDVQSSIQDTLLSMPQ